MTETRPAKRPVTGLAGPYGHPLHPALVTLPIGAWAGSLVFDVASRVVDDPGFLVQGSRWLIALGVLTALGAATVGFLDLFAIPSGTRAHRRALIHMTLNLAVVTSYTVSFLLRPTPEPDTTQGVGIGYIAASAVTFAVLGLSGFIGGELAYRYGVRVADEDTQASGFQ
ncbi:MAG TPA: DUF2231 domain-containing protein [Streptosporangiaceae bacterium]|nr:DUF2231 domain-containing protein [Streptosporangiaceae bacterium]